MKRLETFTKRSKKRRKIDGSNKHISEKLYPAEESKYVILDFVPDESKFIAGGIFGKIYTSPLDDEKLAIKMSYLDVSKDELKNWINITSKCNIGKHTIPLLGSWQDKEYKYYSMPLCGTTLQNVIENEIKEIDIRSVIPNVADALACIHSAGLQHMDVHKGNIIFCQKHGWILIDYGLSVNDSNTNIDVKDFATLIKNIIPYIHLRDDEKKMLEKLYSRLRSENPPSFEQIAEETKYLLIPIL